MAEASIETLPVIRAVCISEKKGMRKKRVVTAELAEDFGIKTDAHADSSTHRQVSLLAMESIQKIRNKGVDVNPGDFAENLTTEGIDLLALPVGSRLRVGSDAVLEVTQHGKKCHAPCAIYYQAGTCVMPTEGIFCRVVSGGMVGEGDIIMPIRDSYRPKR